MQGSVTHVNAMKKFAFATPYDGSEDVFLPPNLASSFIASGQLMSGSRVDFTVGTAAPGKKRPATSLRVISPPADATPPADPATPPASATPPPAATANPAAPAQPATSARPATRYFETGVVAGIELVFSDPYLLISFQANYGGVDVTLLVDGEEEHRAMTDFEGKTEFALEIPADATRRTIEMIVADGKVPYRKLWFRNPPAPKSAEPETTEPAKTEKVVLPDVIAAVNANSEPVDPPAESGAPAAEDATAAASEPEPVPAEEPPAPPALEVKFQYKDGSVYTYQVTTGLEARVVLKSACKIQARVAGTAADWTCSGTGRQHTINAEAENAGATFDLEVNLVTPGDRGVVEFHANGLEHSEYLKNDEEPVTPAAKGVS